MDRFSCVKQFKRPSNWLVSSFIHETGISTNSMLLLLFFIYFDLNLYQQQYKRRRTTTSKSSMCVLLIVRGMSSLWHQLSLSVFLAYVAKRVLFIFFLLKQHLDMSIFLSWMTPFVREKKTLSISVQNMNLSSFFVSFHLSSINVFFDSFLNS